MWVVEVNGRSIGFVQDYRIRDYPDFALLAPDPDASGSTTRSASRVGRDAASGRAMLWAWMLRRTAASRTRRRTSPRPTTATRASLRILAKAGFVQGTWFDEPQRDGAIAHRRRLHPRRTTRAGPTEAWAMMCP